MDDGDSPVGGALTGYLRSRIQILIQTLRPRHACGGRNLKRQQRTAAGSLAAGRMLRQWRPRCLRSRRCTGDSCEAKRRVGHGEYCMLRLPDQTQDQGKESEAQGFRFKHFLKDCVYHTFLVSETVSSIV